MNKIRIIILLLLLPSAGFAQIKVNRFLQSSSIDLQTVSNKVPLVIFINAEIDDSLKDNLLSLLNTALIDYDSFEILLNYITPIKICPPNKTLIINGYDKLPGSFVFDPFLILIGTENNNARRIYRNRLGEELNESENYNTRNSDLSPFYKIKTLDELYKLIKKDCAPKLVMVEKEIDVDSLRHILFKPDFITSRRKIGILIGLGSHLTQYKNTPLSLPVAGQTFDNMPICYDLSAYFQRRFRNIYFYKAIVEIRSFSNSIDLNRFSNVAVDANTTSGLPFIVTPISPLATTTFRHFGIGFGLGLQKNDLIKGINVVLGNDLTIGKAISNGKAQFYLQTTDKSLVMVNNNDFYTNRYSLFNTAYALLEKQIHKRIVFNAGVFISFGYSVMPEQTSYLLVNAKAQYYALEKTSSRINFQSAGFNIGLAYNL